jgi:hypothetical protein
VKARRLLPRVCEIEGCDWPDMIQLPARSSAAPVCPSHAWRPQPLYVGPELGCGAAQQIKGPRRLLAAAEFDRHSRDIAKPLD